MLKMTLANQADIPAGLEDHYAERDGEWQLEVEGVYSKIDRDKQQKALDAERVLKKEAEKRAARAGELQAELDNKNSIISTFKDGGFDEDKMNEMAEQRAADRIRVAVMERDQIQAKLDEAAGSLSEMQGQVDASKIGAEISAAMKGAVRDTAQGIFIQLHRNKFEIVEGKVLTKEGVSDTTMTVTEFVKSEVTKDPDNFAPTSSGGGAGGGARKSSIGDENPFKTGNRTEANILAREDPAKAKALAKAAGLNVHDPVMGAIIKSLG